MSYIELFGNLFNSRAQAYVNTVNCVGAMGKGIALEFRRRYPDMYEDYKKICAEGKLKPGHILPYRKTTPWILNFAIKDDWKQPSKIIWIETCIKKFIATYKDLKIGSVAFPWMGAMNGGIPIQTIKDTMRKYLQNLPDIDIEVYSFEPDAIDPLFEKLLFLIKNNKQEVFSKNSKLRIDKVNVLYEAINSGSIISLARLAESRLLGNTSLDKLYFILNNSLTYEDKTKPHIQNKLFPDY
jgi:O-acetyl-ADP-ribose deacetylase (regulator of RNase III)